MYEGKSHTLFAKYAVPQMIGLLFNSVYMIVDGVFIGNRLGRDAMAAAAVSVPLVEILIALSMAVATGAGVLISSHLGQGEKEKARHIFSLAALCTAVMGLLISVLGNIFKSQPPLQVVVWVGPHKGRLHARPKGRVSQALLLVRL